eukprot:evm.model.NODE_7059_length_31966_cov_21.646906.10
METSRFPSSNNATSSTSSTSSSALTAIATIKPANTYAYIQALGIHATGIDAKELEERTLLEVSRLRGNSFEIFPSKPEVCDVILKCTIARPAVNSATSGALAGGAATMATIKRERSFSASSSVSTVTTLAADDTEEEEAGDTEGEDSEGTTGAAVAAATAVVGTKEGLVTATAAAAAAGKDVVWNASDKGQHYPMLEEDLMPLLLVGEGVEDQVGEEEAGKGGKRKHVEGDRAQKKHKGLHKAVGLTGSALDHQQHKQEDEKQRDGNVKMTTSVSSASPSHQPQALQSLPSNPHQKRAVSVGGSNVRVLYARSVILAEKSQYFDRAFRRGGFREMGERQLELNFEDEEEFDDFARLIRLCHGPSFTSEATDTAGGGICDGNMEGGGGGGGGVGGCGGAGRRRELRREELLRLVLVADAFEVVQCVEEGVAALCARMGYTLAVKTFQKVPDGLRNHEAIRRLLLAAGAALAKGIGVLAGAKIWSRRRPDVSRGGKDKEEREEKGECGTRVRHNGHLIR